MDLNLPVVVFIALAALLVLVFLVLPQQATPTISEELAKTQPQNTSNNEVSKETYQDALLAQQRAQAQTVLSEFMDL